MNATPKILRSAITLRGDGLISVQCAGTPLARSTKGDGLGTGRACPWAVAGLYPLQFGAHTLTASFAQLLRTSDSTTIGTAFTNVDIPSTMQAITISRTSSA